MHHLVGADAILRDVAADVGLDQPSHQIFHDCRVVAECLRGLHRFGDAFGKRIRGVETPQRIVAVVADFDMRLALVEVGRNQFPLQEFNQRLLIWAFFVARCSYHFRSP